MLAFNVRDTSFVRLITITQWLHLLLSKSKWLRIFKSEKLSFVEQA